jgi:hypothetical protein
MAAHIMETAGLGGAVDYRRVWQGKRQNAAGGPRLENLHTQKEWFAALEAYGGGATYGTAALAVLALRQRHGYEPLLAYFRALSRLSPEDAFHQTFGVRLSSFERDFEY